MTANLNELLEEAKTLEPAEQIRLIQMLSETLGLHVDLPVDPSDTQFPTQIRRTAPLTDLSSLAADFWPEEESADDINKWVRQQRDADRLADYE